MTSDLHTKNAMDSMYRLTRHVYDATRKYYLLGRDRLIAQLKPSDNEIIIEVGCGTARNLIKMQETYPNADFYGLDASDEMLKTARKSLEKKEINLPLAQGYAQNYEPKKLFGLSKKPDKIVFSYALSIIPPWRDSVDHAVDLLKKGGEIHIVDFGGQDGLPRWFRKFLFWWLDIFHVYHKPEILEYLQTLQEDGVGSLAYESLYGGYSYIAVFKKA